MLWLLNIAACGFWAMIGQRCAALAPDEKRFSKRDLKETWCSIVHSSVAKQSEGWEFVESANASAVEFKCHAGKRSLDR